MKKNHRKRVVSVNEVFVVVIGLIIVIFAVLCKFGLISGDIEIEIPRNDVAFRAKRMYSEDLPIIPVSREEFKKIDLTDEEKLVFLDVSDFQSGLEVIKIWIMAEGKIFFYVEEIKGYPLLTSISDIDVRFFSHINKMKIILYR